MNDPVLLRPAVRNALRAATGKPLSETRLKLGIERIVGEPISVPEFSEALAWNYERGFVTFTRNTELEIDEWILTPKGKAREGAK